MSNENKLEFIADLITAQSQLKPAGKTAINPRFGQGYADLTSVLDACMDALHSNDLMLTQPVIQDESGLTVITRIMHISGESIETGIPLILQKNDMQGLGSAITYARRYGLVTLLGISQEDDDGNSISIQQPKKKVKVNQEHLARLEAAQKLGGLNDWEINKLKEYKEGLQKFGSLKDWALDKIAEIEKKRAPKKHLKFGPIHSTTPRPTPTPEPEPETGYISAKKEPQNDQQWLECPEGMTFREWLEDFAEDYGGVAAIDSWVITRKPDAPTSESWTDGQIRSAINAINSGAYDIKKLSDTDGGQNE